jgi:hypothetical protein
MTSNRALYEHRQLGWPMVASSLVPFLCLIAFWVVGQPAQRSFPPLLIPGICVLSAIVLIGFSTLSIVVTKTHLVARFGIGLPRRAIALDDIASFVPTQTRWYEGWGIHYTRSGMLYNVQGFEAVRITLVNGRSLRIGTDEAQRLCNAIARAIDARRKGMARPA